MWVGEVRTRLSAFSEAIQRLADRAHMEQPHVDRVLARLHSLEQRLLNQKLDSLGAFMELLALESEINDDLGEL